MTSLREPAPIGTDRMRRAVRRALLRFYARHARDLPWRRTRDPYRIWVSEIMLQQTQVITVLPRYEAFLARFPDVQALANASEHQVCEAWAGLGYYRRARHLHQAAHKICTELGGDLPTTAAAWRELPGIGRYTAGAIASIAYEECAPLVDGNVLRVLSRLFAIPGGKQEERQVWQLAELLVHGEKPGDWNQALMELGATLCTPTAPACKQCPARRLCVAWAQGNPENYPSKRKAAARQALAVAYAYLEEAGSVWLTQRPLTGLWAGLWELPSAEGAGAKQRLEALVGVALGRAVVKVQHELTHRAVTASVYRLPTGTRLPAGVGMRLSRAPLAEPLSALARRAILAVTAARLPRSTKNEE